MQKERESVVDCRLNTFNKQTRFEVFFQEVLIKSWIDKHIILQKDLTGVQSM